MPAKRSERATAGARSRLRAALQLRCPVCRCGPIEPGYFIGAMYFSYALTTLMLLPLMGLVWLVTRWSFLPVVLTANLLLLPLVPLLFHASRGLWLHFDHLPDPPRPKER